MASELPSPEVSQGLSFFRHRRGWPRRRQEDWFSDAAGEEPNTGNAAMRRVEGYGMGNTVKLALLVGAGR